MCVFVLNYVNCILSFWFLGNFCVKRNTIKDRVQPSKESHEQKNLICYA